MRKPTIKPRVAVPLTLLAVGGGWVAGATLGTPTLSAAATASTSNIGTGPAGPGPRGPGGRIGLDFMANAAKDIGIPKQALRSELASGKTVAQVAAEHNVSAATLISELVSTAKTDITQAYAAGRITATRESNMLTHVQAMVTNFVDNSMSARMGPGRAVAIDLMANAAKDIGIPKQALRGELASGKTVAQVAAEHNVSAATLISELVSTAKTDITQAYAVGRITATRESNMLTHVQTMVTNFVDNPMRARMGPGRAVAVDLMANAAKDIGIPKQALRSELASGKTVAQVAAEHNVSAATMISELVSTAKTDITQAYAAGRITATRESNMFTHVQTMVTNFVDNPMRARMGPGWPGGPMGGRTSASSATASV